MHHPMAHSTRVERLLFFANALQLENLAGLMPGLPALFPKSMHVRRRCEVRGHCPANDAKAIFAARRKRGRQHFYSWRREMFSKNVPPKAKRRRCARAMAAAGIASR